MFGEWHAPCRTTCSSLLTDRNEMSTIYRGPSTDASYQISVYLVKRFQRRRILEIDQTETRNAYGGHVYYIYRCSLPSFGLFGQAVSDVKIQM